MKGYTLVEVIMSLAIVLILICVVCFSLGGCGIRGASEDAVRKAGEKFVSENNIKLKRFSCAGDSDGDGYGTCVIVTTDGEKIKLQCPGLTSSWAGATSCKEDFANVNYTGQFPL